MRQRFSLAYFRLRHRLAWAMLPIKVKGIRSVPPILLGKGRRLWHQVFRRRETVEEQNNWNLYLDVTWWGVLSGITSTFVSVFAIRLGASNTLVGLLVSLPALINIFWLMPSARLIERQRRRLPIIVLTGFLQRMGYLLIALMPFVLRTHRPEALVALVALITFPTAMTSVAFTSLIAEVVPADKRAQVVSIRNVLVSTVSTVTVLISGKLLDLLPFPFNYQLLFGTGFAASLVSLYHVSRIQVADVSVAEQQAQAKVPVTIRLRQLVKRITSQGDFVRFSASAFVFHWGLYLPSALYAIYRVRNLGASDTWIGLLSMVQNAVTIVTYLYWGRVASRKGNRFVLLISSLGIVLFPVLTGLSTRVEPLIIPSIMAGIFGAGFNLSFFNTLLEVCPQERRPSFVAINTTLINVAAFLSPLLGTSLANRLDIRVAFFIAGALRLLGAGFFYKLNTKY
jgi:predicted MFS family arabinose efflux permease